MKNKILILSAISYFFLGLIAQSALGMDSEYMEENREFFKNRGAPPVTYEMLQVIKDVEKTNTYEYRGEKWSVRIDKNADNFAKYKAMKENQIGITIDKLLCCSGFNVNSYSYEIKLTQKGWVYNSSPDQFKIILFFVGNKRGPKIEEVEENFAINMLRKHLPKTFETINSIGETNKTKTIDELQSVFMEEIDDKTAHIERVLKFCLSVLNWSGYIKDGVYCEKRKDPQASTRQIQPSPTQTNPQPKPACVQKVQSHPEDDSIWTTKEAEEFDQWLEEEKARKKVAAIDERLARDNKNLYGEPNIR